MLTTHRRRTNNKVDAVHLLVHIIVVDIECVYYISYMYLLALDNTIKTATIPYKWHNFLREVIIIWGMAEAHVCRL